MRPFLALLALSLPLVASADEKMKALFKKCAPAVVYIETKPNEEGSYHCGTGSILDADGIIVTNHHVVDAAIKTDGEVKVFLFDGRQFMGQVYAHTEKLDLALVRLTDSPGGLPVMEWGDSDGLEVGEDVIAIGNPDGLRWTLSTGIVSGKRDDWIQTTAPLNPGNSGGPLISPDGRQVGVNTLSKYADRNNIAFARCAKVARGWVEQVSAGDMGGPVTPRYVDPDYGFSMTPPQGWSRLDEQSDFLRCAYGNGDVAVRVYMIPEEGLRGVRQHAADREAQCQKDCKRFRKVSLDFFEFRGKEDAYGFTYTWEWEGTIWTSYELAVNDNGDLWGLRFVSPEAKHASLLPTYDEVVKNSRWSGSKDVEAHATPEKCLESWIQAIRTGDLEAYMATMDVAAFLDSSTQGQYGKASAAQKKEMERKFRENVQAMLKGGALAKQIDKGVRILGGTIDGDRATVPLVSVTDAGQTVVEDAYFVKSGDRWYMTGFGAARLYEEGGREPEDGGERGLKTKKFKDEKKTFALDLPEGWSQQTTDYENGIVVHVFSESDVTADPETYVIVTVADIRKDVKDAALNEEQLDTLTENFLKSVREEFKHRFNQKAKKKTKLGGVAALRVDYVGQIEKLSPEFHATVWVTYKNGWAYMVTLMRRGGGEAAAPYQGIVDSFQVTGKR